MDYELVVCEKCHAEHNGYSEGSEGPYSTTNSGQEDEASGPGLPLQSSQSPQGQQGQQALKQRYEKRVDPSTTLPYYYDAMTGHSTWTPPAGWQEPSESSRDNSHQQLEANNSYSRALAGKVLPHTGPRWHTKCRRCGCQAATNDVVHEVPATTHSEGSRRMHSSCKYCGKEDSWTETIPRVVKTSSSSSSSGGFGGGSSSGGGGASSSW